MPEIPRETIERLSAARTDGANPVQRLMATLVLIAVDMWENRHEQDAHVTQVNRARLEAASRDARGIPNESWVKFCQMPKTEFMMLSESVQRGTIGQDLERYINPGQTAKTGC
jgi:hypothetical protein